MSDEETGATTAPFASKLTTPAESPPASPAHIGRYRVERLLGQGGFGLVYLAYDDQLNRQVAIKVPHSHLVADPGDAESYLAEARTVANLDHPNIVPVHDVGSTEEIPCFIVAKYIDGTDLAAWLGRSRFSIEESVKLVATVAEALHHAHRQGLVHRDVKPGNILLDRGGKPFVTDFGLALREQDIGKEPDQAGTPPYMSPEQARGEGHRVDARSDIFSLGVVLYQLLVGQRPFRGDTKEELLDQIVNQEPRPPRQFDDRIPLELDRICLKALAKRASERYSTAQDMADDLRHLSDLLRAQPVQFVPLSSGRAPAVFRERAPSTPATVSTGPLPSSGLPSGSGAVQLAYPSKIVPKGLRSFDEHDADFFLELLPGPRDREGLPDSIRFWKTHIEETDADKTFPVGLIYGPSGCGKSSQVKAGLLPRLAAHVLTVYLEATPHQTEIRLLNGLRKRCPALPDYLDLKRAIAFLRRGQGIASGRKVLIVIDQFEQWLHGRTDEQEADLVQALRQCDGGHVQCVVMVRDDFWMAATRFMRQLELPLVEGHNSAAVDLFPLRHAEKVLASFGRAFGCLPEDSNEMTYDERQFLAQGVSALAQEGKVICVRLALFSEMTKGRPWKMATLKEMGGAERVGFAFLEETFTAASAPPQHRHHQRAARAVLQALLPDSGSEIKGHMRSRSELAEASGYSGRPNDFDDLIRMLDGELRLIAPTDPAGVGTDENGQPPWKASQKYYQLSHDYLVPSLRDWLTRKQKETRVGRAELLLADRAETWNARKESRQLPSVWEYSAIALLTRRKDWTEPQRRMIRAATRHYLARATATVVLGCVLLAAVWQGWRWNTDQRATLKAQALLERVLGADASEVPRLLSELEPFRKHVNEALESAAFDSSPSKQSLHASLALLPDHPKLRSLLQERLLRSSPQEVVLIRGALGELVDRANNEASGETVAPSEFFWQVLEGERRSADERFRAAAAEAGLAPLDERWTKAAFFVADALTKQDSLFLNDWIQALRPIGGHLIEPLCAVFRDTKRTAADRSHAAVALAEFAADDPPKLTQLLVDADAAQFEAILPKLRLHHDDAVKLLKPVARGSEADAEVDKEAAAARQANAAIALALLGQVEGLWPMLAHHDDPRLRTYLVRRLAPLRVDAQQLVDRLGGEPDPSVRQALVLALSRLAPESLPAQTRTQATDAAAALYRGDLDPGVHAAAEYLLRRWDRADRLALPAESSARTNRRTRPGWYTDQHGHTMVVIPGPVTFEMGARPDESGSYPPPEQLHLQHIGRSFALASKEVTVEQFLSYNPAHPFSPDYSPEPACPVNNVNWYDAARYCRWLSEREGVEESQMCFPPAEQIKEGMRLPSDYLTRTGYRLPTEAEWEYVCRAGAATSRCFGESEELLADYAWTFANSQFRDPARIDSRYRARPVGSLLPNDLGMFDILGNAMEWCQESYRSSYVVRDDGRPTEDEEDVEEVLARQRRPTRGGAYLYQPSDAKAPHRDHHPAGARQPYMGFRVARTVRD